MTFSAPAPAARRKARHYAMQALYQWQMSKLDPWEITGQFREEYDMTHVDVEYFEELVQSIPRQLDAIDAGFEPFLQGRSLNELDPITLALLRIATYELIRRIDVPYKVSINEAVALARKFGATDAHKFINGVLDKAAATHRVLETKGKQSE